MQDFTVYTKRPEREATCRACRWQQRAGDWSPDWSDTDPPDRHTCRTPPATPQDVVNERARAADKVIADVESQVRKRRLAEINASARRGV